MSDDRATDVDVEQLEQEAQELLDGGHGEDSLVLAVDQLHADRTNGEPLETAIRSLRAALAEVRGPGTGRGRT